MPKLKVSHPSQEGVLRVSKWLKHQVLLDAEEMRELCDALMPCALYNVSEVVRDGEVNLRLFLDAYISYVEALKLGKVLGDKEIRQLFSLALSAVSSVFYQMEVKPDHYLIKAIRPIVQMQLHQFLPSKLDGKFHPMVLSAESVSWGLQFSYPQICQDPQTNVFSKVRNSEEFPNTQLFDNLVRWLRNFTAPVTFIWKDKKTSTSMRLGKKCFSWINDHPQLKEKGIHVHIY